MFREVEEPEEELITEKRNPNPAPRK